MARQPLSDMERQRNIVWILDPNPKGKRRTPGILQGPRDAEFNKVTLELAKLGGDLNSRIYDIQGNGALPSRKGIQLKQAVGPVLKTYDTLATQFRTERQRVRRLMSELDPVKPYESLTNAYVALTLDLRRLDDFKALPLGEKQGKLAQILDEPGLDLSFAEAVTRLPGDLTERVGIDWNARTQVRLGLIQLLRHEAFDALSLNIDQAEVALSALQHVAEIVYDATGTYEDLRREAPVAETVVLGAEKDDHLYWVQPQPLRSADRIVLSIPPTAREAAAAAQGNAGG